MCFGAGLLALTGCSPTPVGTPSSAAGVQSQPAESGDSSAADPGPTDESASPSREDEPLEALTSDEMLDLLIGPGDLPEAPSGHSTHSGAEYFEDEVVVEFHDYRDRFGQGACAATMDSINVDLIGDDVEDGLMHMYRFSNQQGQDGLLYVWAVAYVREVDTSQVWDEVESQCTDSALQNETDSVDVSGFDVESFSGVQLTIQSRAEGAEEAVTTFSAAADTGENLVMMSSVGLEEDQFRDIVETQQRKLAAQDSSAD